MSRTVRTRLDEERIKGMLKEHGEHVYTAIGYLSTWAHGWYDQVTIWSEGWGVDMIAEYKDTRTNSVYVIGAVWHEERHEYGFHS